MLKNRLIIFVAAAFGSVSWLGAGSYLQAATGGSGYVLSGASSGWGLSLAMTAVFGLPAMILACLVGAIIRPVTGYFVFAVSLAVLAARGGDMGDWIRTHGDPQVLALPGQYGELIFEAFVWQAMAVAVFCALRALRHPLQGMLPGLKVGAGGPPHTHAALEGQLPIGVGIAGGLVTIAIFGTDNFFAWVVAGGLAVGAFLIQKQLDDAPPWAAMLIGFVITTIVAFAISFLLIRGPATGQVMWSLVIAFAIASCLARAMFYQRSPLPILLSPCIVALVAYGMMLSAFADNSAVVSLYNTLAYNARLPGGAAFALPIQIIAAGSVGCCVGLGIGEAISHADPQDAKAAGDAEAKA